MIRDQDWIGLYVSAAIVAVVGVLTIKALFSAPPPRASARVLVGVVR